MVHHSLGEPFIIPTAYANDEIDGDISNSVEFDNGGLNTNQEGTYKITWTVYNSRGEYTTKSINIVVSKSEIGTYTGYYQSLNGLTGTTLNSQLSYLIRTTGRTTGNTSEVQTIDSYNGQNYNIYTGYGTYGNREHVWPKSLLGSGNPIDDLHNLRAAVMSVNSTRSNYPFTNQVTQYNWELIQSKFYPGQEHVGDVARIVLYMSIRNNISLNLVGNLSMFLNWHIEDPVSDFEISRNNKIYSIQNNRNPFIDHPKLVNQYFN